MTAGSHAAGPIAGGSFISVATVARAAAPAPTQARKALWAGRGGVFVYRWARARSRWGSSDGVHRTY